MSANSALDHCLRADPAAPACESVAAWWSRWRTIAAATGAPVERAIRGGFDADRVGWAFASGYQAALRALVPGLGDDTVAAFCVTEEGGNRPRDIRTTISLPDATGTVSISGAKRWTTL
jgi:alkylation response protein AidB-like acyl-CoA dehydrogenase